MRAWYGVAAVLLWGCGVRGGLPQCSTLVTSCIMRSTTSLLGDDYSSIDESVATVDYTPSNPTEVCKASHWKAVDACFTGCPLRLVITDPPHLAMKLCMQDNEFSPFVMSGHIDEQHPLQRKELEIVGVGNPLSTSDTSRQGCSPEAYTAASGKNYTGKIVMIRRGGCKFVIKAQEAQAAGAAAAVLYNSVIPESLIEQMRVMVGSSDGIDIPALFVQKAGGDQVVAHLDKGGSARGYLELQCTPDGEPDEYTDECPDKAEALLEHFDQGCLAYSDKICGRCEGVLVHEGSEFCLRGNDLRPRRKKNNLWQTHVLPHEVAVLLVRRSGCTKADFPSEVAGKVALVRTPTACLAYEAVLNAQQAGAAGVIFLPPLGKVFAKVAGPSKLVSIFVHSMSPDSAQVFLEKAESAFGGMEVADLGRLRVRAGEYDEYVALREERALQTVEQLEEAASGWQWTTAVVVALVTVVVLLVCAVTLLVLQVQRSRALARQVYTGEKRCSVPLGIAFVLASVTLLVGTSVTAFMLAHEAGEARTDKVLQSGNEGVEATFANAVANIEELNTRWMWSVMAGVISATHTFFQEPQMVGTGFAKMVRYYDGQYSTFRNFWLPLKSLEQSTGDRWLLALRTRAGFYIDGQYSNDDRSDVLRNDGQPHITVTQDGYRYGHVQMKLVDGLYTVSDVVTRTEWDPMQRVGRGYHDTFVLAAGVSGATPFVWLIDNYTTPDGQSSYEHPVVMLMPVYSTLTGSMVATLEMHRTVGDLGDYFAGALGTRPVMQNVTAACFTEQGTLLSVYQGQYPEPKAGFSQTYKPIDRYKITSYKNAHTSRNLGDTDVTELRAFGAYLESQKSEITEGSFEQSEHFKANNGWDTWYFDFKSEAREGALLVDLSGNRYKAALTAGVGGAPTVHDGVLHLVGSGYLTVYSYLTPDVPRVARTQLSANPWRSSFKPFANVAKSEEGLDVVTFFDGHAEEWSPVLREPIVSENLAITVQFTPRVDVPERADAFGTAPRIFSDTGIGDATVRWFANGKLLVGINTFGCETPPVAGGLQANTPYHMTASIDWERNECKVYVNGTLHSRRDMSRQRRNDFHYEHYRIGEGLVGEMDYIRVLHTSISDAEAEHLFKEGGTFKRIVPHRRWRYAFEKLKVPGVPPLNMAIVLLVPEADILEQVQESNRVTRNNLRVQDLNTRVSLDTRTNESVFILMAVVLLGICAFLFLNDLMTRPFVQFACLLNDAAMMRVDELSVSHSFLSELNALYRSLHRMLWNLKEYRSYMPQSLLRDLDEITSDDDTAEGSTHSSNKSRTARTSLSLSHAVPPINNATDVSLTRRKAAFALLNVCSFHEVTVKGTDELIQFHSAVLQTGYTICNNNKGVAETFSGDRLVCTFNGSKGVANPAAAATRSILQFQNIMYDDKRVPVSTSVVMGEMLMGNMGCGPMKRFCCVSPRISWMYALERFARHRNEPGLIDDTVAKTAHNILHMVVDQVRYPKYRKSPIVVSRVMERPDEDKVEEWMYTIEDSLLEAARRWNNACLQLFDGNYHAAATMFDGLPKKDDDPAFARLVKAAEDKAFSPTEILFH
eukprot:Sspe_Gene.69266::Locus_40829_Transcript_1_1_Confidence_1.000_Length_4841::g.69266::m.69266